MNKVPTLPLGCGSWVVTSPDGSQVRELYTQGGTALAASLGWKVETALAYLHRINQAAKTGNAA